MELFHLDRVFDYTGVQPKRKDSWLRDRKYLPGNLGFMLYFASVDNGGGIILANNTRRPR